MSKHSPIVVGLGEMLCDCYGERRKPGGAPANVAFHAAQLGLHGIVFSRVGRDVMGDELLAHLKKHGLSTDYVLRDAHYPTGRAEVSHDSSGQPSYVFPENTAFDHLEFAPYIEQLMVESSAVCFGTLAQRNEVSRETIRQCIQATSDSCLIVYDVNLRSPWHERQWIESSLEMAAIAKLNEEECGVLAEMFGMDGADLPEFADRLRQRHKLELVCVTLGEAGCILVDGEQKVRQSGMAVEAKDPVGAGDAFSAALIYARLNHWPLDATAALANDLAARVACHVGPMPDLSKEIPGLLDAHRPQS